MRKQISLLVVLTASSLWALPERAAAGTFYCCGQPNNTDMALKWANPTQTFKVLPNTGWPVNSIVDAAAGWNNAADSNFVFNMVWDDDNSVTTNGDGNEIGWFGNAPADGTIALTATRYNKCQSCDDWTCGGTSCSPARLTEADVYIYGNNSDGSPRSWVAYPSSLDGRSSLFALAVSVVMSHELGHALGLGHTDFGMARMESHDPAGGWFHDTVPQGGRAMPLPQDRTELNFLYPSAGLTTELATINMQHLWGSSDPNGTIAQSMPLSWHQTNGLWWFPANRVVRNGNRQTVTAGDTVDIRICADNLGNSGPSGATPISIWLSADTVIGSGDFETGNGWSYVAGTFAGRVARCDDIFFTVPAAAPNGSYVVAYSLGAPTGQNVTIINQRILKI
jgi:hypothetical protein